MKTLTLITALLVTITTPPVLADDADAPSTATYALAIEQTDGAVEKLITIGDHDACMQLVEQAEKPHKLSCVTTARVASQ